MLVTLTAGNSGKDVGNDLQGANLVTDPGITESGFPDLFPVKGAERGD